MRETPYADTIIGWREWLALPDLGVARIKAKVDTGARSSSLHASALQPFQRDGVDWVRFRILPEQDEVDGAIEAEAPVLEYRDVRSSNGVVTRRPVIETTLEWMDQRWPIELTLADRKTMGFRMLVGREAIRRRALVDPGRSYYDKKLKPRPSSRRKRGH